MAQKNHTPATAEPAIRTAMSYVRFSSRQQAEGDTLRRQRDLAKAWCERNGVKLDESHVFEDHGRSAYRKHHSDREALSEFRRLVAEGRIRPGTVLLIENLDRLSREEERIAVELLLSIVNAGITVVQLLPEEQVFSPDKLDMLGLMRAVIQMAQAHQESAKKAKRLGEKWSEKRRAAIAGEAILTPRVPGWVDLVDGKLKLNPTHAALVRRIFKLCIQGFGGQAIARKFNAEGVPTLTGRGRWYQSAVTYILRSRATVGEHQPHSQHGKKNREPIGEPLRNYYPAVVSEDTWNAAQAAMLGRITLAGRPAAVRTNIFRGLLRDARGGKKIGIHTHTKGKVHYQVYSNSDRASGEPERSFSRDAFEEEILRRLLEVDPREVIGESIAAERVLALTGERAALAGKIDKLVNLLGDSPSSAVMAKVRAMEPQLRDEDARLTAAQQEAANPLANAWGDFPGLVELAKTEPGRVRLAAILRRIVASIWCLFIPRGDVRIAAVQIWFRPADRSRLYFIWHRKARQLTPTKRREATWGSWSDLPAALSGEDAALVREVANAVTRLTKGKPDPDDIEAAIGSPLDLRRPEDVRFVTEMIERADLAAL